MELCTKSCPCRTAAKFAGPSNQKRGFDSPRGYQRGGPRRLGYLEKHPGAALVRLRAVPASRSGSVISKQMGPRGASLALRSAQLVRRSLFSLPVSRSRWVIVNQRYQGPAAQLVHRVSFAGRSVWVTPGSGARAPAGSNPARPDAPLVRFLRRVSAGRSNWVIATDESGSNLMAGASLQLQGHTLPAVSPRVQLGGRALPRRGREGWFDSIHAHASRRSVDGTQRYER